jgi:4-amino-4-deoxy-L-arabinose transferase-like glycosyltransferase
LIGLLSRVFFLIYHTDVGRLDFYEYGAIAENMHKGNGYSLFYYNNDKLEIGSNEKITPYMSAFMPPGYTCIVYLFNFINDIEIRNYSILFLQILLSLITIFVFFLLTKEVFNYTSALIAAVITAILPEFVYTSCLPGTTIFFHLGIGVILLLLFRLEHSLNVNMLLILTGITFGILILFRSEVVLLLFLILIYYLVKKRFKHITIILFVSFIIVVPWGTRNFLVFKEVVPLSTSFGLNFYRGHNPYDIGVWADQEIVNNLLKYKDDPNFELRLNELYSNKGFENIIKNPSMELGYVFTKLFHLWIYNPQDERTKSIFYLGPWLILIILFLMSLNSSFSWRGQKYIYFFLIYFNLLVIFFFCLPRYQTMMKLAIIPFAGDALRILVIKIIEKFHK